MNEGDRRVIEKVTNEKLIGFGHGAPPLKKLLYQKMRHLIGARPEQTAQRDAGGRATECSCRVAEALFGSGVVEIRCLAAWVLG